MPLKLCETTKNSKLQKKKRKDKKTQKHKIIGKQHYIKGPCKTNKC